MIEYSHNNTLRFAYDGVDFARKPNADSVLSYTMDRCTREPGNFKEECVAVAKLLGEKAAKQGRVPYLMLSGGMDSEVMVKAFIEAEVPFKTITFKFDYDLNSHEIAYVEKFCAANGLKPNYFSINALSWIKSENAARLFNKSYASSAVMMCHCKTLNHVWRNLDGMPILGGGDVVIEQHEDSTWYYSKYEYILAWYWHMRSNKIDGGVAFFQHIPEITLAMLREPEIVSVASGADIDANELLNDCRIPKYMVYSRYWPDLEQRQKFGGAEKVGKTFRGMSKALIAARPIKYKGTWSMPYADFVASIEPAK